MKISFKALTLAFTMASLSTVSIAEEMQKIAVVFPSKIMQQSPQLEKIKQKLQSEFKARIASLKALEKEITTIESTLERDAELMSANEVTILKRKRAVKLSEYKLDREAFREDNRRRQGEEQQKSWAVIHDVIKNVATKNGYDVVFSGEQLIYSKPALDISDIVIKEISKK